MFFGAFAEQVVTSTKTVAKLPEAVSFEIGASVLVTYGTTMHGLIDRARMKAGETLLVLGAAGGVGTAAVEIGKCLGAKVIAAASSAEKLEYCKAHGADLVINYATEDLKERAKALSGGGVDVTYDAVGGPLTEAALRAMGWYGRHLVIGFAAGDIPKIPINLLLLKSCDLIGVFWGQCHPARSGGQPRAPRAGVRLDRRGEDEAAPRCGAALRGGDRGAQQAHAPRGEGEDRAGPLRGRVFANRIVTN